jgi:hypothetical protein
VYPRRWPGAFEAAAPGEQPGEVQDAGEDPALEERPTAAWRSAYGWRVVDDVGHPIVGREAAPGEPSAQPRRAVTTASSKAASA